MRVDQDLLLVLGLLFPSFSENTMINGGNSGGGEAIVCL